MPLIDQRVVQTFTFTVITVIPNRDQNIQSMYVVLLYLKKCFDENIFSELVSSDIYENIY